MLGGHLNWDWASQLIMDVEANDGDTDTRLSIVNKNGVALVGPDKGTTRYTGAQLADILKARKGTFTEISGGQRVLTAFYVGKGHREYQGLNWIVTANQPTGVALAAAMSSAKIILGFGVITALIGLALAMVISRRVARPIIAITREADRIGRARSTMLARQSGSVEVVQLTRALRSLLRRIGFAEERTKEAELRAAENALQFKDDLVKLQKMADTDYLTGLMNRRAFLTVADDTVEFCRRYKRGMATLMIDIDHFKKINDAHGHAAGDDAIKRIAEIIDQSIRTTDKAARFGGEEFVVLLREIDQETALLLARADPEFDRASHDRAWRNEYRSHGLDRRRDQCGCRPRRAGHDRTRRSGPLHRQEERPQPHHPDAGLRAGRPRGLSLSGMFLLAQG